MPVILHAQIIHTKEQNFYHFYGIGNPKRMIYNLCECSPAWVY